MMRKRVLSPARTLALTRAVTMGDSAETGIICSISSMSSSMTMVMSSAIMLSFSTRSGPTT